VTTGTRKQDLLCHPQEEQGGLMSAKNDKDPSVVELKGKLYSISKLRSRVDIFTATTRFIGEYVGQKFGHEMRMLVLYSQLKAAKHSECLYSTSVVRQRPWAKEC
jgi:hypothetical protein